MLTRQEMFDRAVRGLASQGWKACESGSHCAYTNDQGHHCAWGWVDTSLAEKQRGSVVDLRKTKVGLAAGLSDKDLKFAQELQVAHDTAIGEVDMREKFATLSRRHGLVWPSDVPIE